MKENVYKEFGTYEEMAKFLGAQYGNYVKYTYDYPGHYKRHETYGSTVKNGKKYFWAKIEIEKV